MILFRQVRDKVDDEVGLKAVAGRRYLYLSRPSHLIDLPEFLRIQRATVDADVSQAPLEKPAALHGALPNAHWRCGQSELAGGRDCTFFLPIDI
jgi:hypothetical protein